MSAKNMYIILGPNVNMIVRAVLIGIGNYTFIHFNIFLIERLNIDIFISSPH